MGRNSVSMPLNGWHEMFYGIYGLKNIERDRFRLFAHLVEVIAGFAKELRKGNDPEEIRSFLAKMFAWFCALAKELRIDDLEVLLWNKFPAVCPYCLHATCSCGLERDNISLGLLERMRIQNERRRPVTVNDWQRMFREIYGVGGIPPERLTSTAREFRVHHAFFRLLEELGELAEAARLEHVEPAGVRNELADVIAWVFALSNLLPDVLGTESINLAQLCWDTYPGRCNYCGQAQCKCPNDRVRGRLSTSGVFHAERLDDLTGAQLRGAFDTDIVDSLLRAESVHPVALCLFDIDHFKSFNDTHGHQAGDLVLRRVCDTIISVSAGRGGRIYRYGGEEIAVLFDDTTDKEAAAIADRVRGAIERLSIEYTPPGQPKADKITLQVTVSCGVSASDGSRDSDASIMVKEADDALYAAKHAGRNQVHLFSSEPPSRK